MTDVVDDDGHCKGSGGDWNKIKEWTGKRKRGKKDCCILWLL